MSTERSLDRIDIGIVNALQKDGRLSNKELAAEVGLAPSSCLERVKRLRERGVIRGFHADVDPVAMGVGIQAIIAIRLGDQSRSILERFMQEVPALPEVVTLLNLAGDVDYLLHVMVRDTDHLRDFVLEGLASRKEVAHYQTNLLFQEIRSDGVPCFL
jgi:DNA-binding Lrp family transcriptional regulator